MTKEQAAPGDGLFTDLYELTMLQAYFNEGMEDRAVFDLFVRTLPEERNFFVACGLGDVLDFVEELHFPQESLDYLASLDRFSDGFLDYLSRLRFEGSVRAVPEGTVVFPDEPVLEVAAPVPQAQLIETYLLSEITFQTTIASKGARAVLAAGGRGLVDFGSRRAQGSGAALKAARSLYVAGYDSTSNTLAGRLYGIPVSGTVAHSYIQAHDDEMEAFRAFLRTYPESVLLVDTYDTLDGVRKAVELAREPGGATFRAIRLDSGDLVQLAKESRRILDEAGLNDVSIFASGGLDEAKIQSLVAAGAPIDGFGVGTSAAVSDDAPALDSAYKLVSYAGKPRIKLSTGKSTLPGEKQVFRKVDGGVMSGDVIGLADESIEGEPLLAEMMRDGRRTAAGRATIEDARERVKEQIARLPESLRRLEKSDEPYPVTVSGRLEAEREAVRKALE